MTNEVELKLALPSDEEAIDWLEQGVMQQPMTGMQATNVLAIRAWLAKLKERLAHYNAESAAKMDPISTGNGAEDPHLPDEPDSAAEPPLTN